MKRVFIIHGWDGFPEEGWFPWAKKELERKGYTVVVPEMPTPSAPSIPTWIKKIGSEVGELDSQTILIGHSIGCQAIIRFLESLKGPGKAGKMIIVAGWLTLTPESTPGPEEEKIAAPWLTKAIDFEKVKSRAESFCAIMSDNDPYVPISNADSFRDKLGAKIVMEHGKGHIGGPDKITELPSLLKEIP